VIVENVFSTRPTTTWARPAPRCGAGSPRDTRFALLTGCRHLLRGLMRQATHCSCGPMCRSRAGLTGYANAAPHHRVEDLGSLVKITEARERSSASHQFNVTPR